MIKKAQPYIFDLAEIFTSAAFDEDEIKLDAPAI